MRLYSGSDPVFDEKDIFRLTVPLDADYSPEKGHMRRVDGTTEKATEKAAEKATEKVRECSSAESRLRAIIARSPTVSMAEMAREMNMLEDGIYYHIKALKDAGKLRRIGGRKTGHWEFVDRGKN